jgi:(S)-sulfolactate dehydrogenase
MKKILITEIMDIAEVEKLQSKFKTIYDEELFKDQTKIIKIIPDIDGLIVRNNTLVNEAIINAAINLKVIGRLGVGLNNINVDLCKNKNIKIIPAIGANTISVAEYVVSSMLVLSKKIFFSTDAVISGLWPRNKLMNGNELYNQTLGIIGLGNIGRSVAEKAKSFSMNIISYDPYIKSVDAQFSYIKMKSLEDLLTKSDIVTLHVPLSLETENLINENKINMMKPGSILINTSRGEILDENAVIKNLKSGKLGGAALDVFRKEPMTKMDGKKFLHVPNLLCTPHISGLTNQSNKRVSSLIANSVIEFFNL